MRMKGSLVHDKSWFLRKSHGRYLKPLGMLFQQMKMDSYSSKLPDEAQWRRALLAVSFLAAITSSKADVNKLYLEFRTQVGESEWEPTLVHAFWLSLFDNRNQLWS